MPLPGFLCGEGEGAPSPQELADGFALTGFFLASRVYEPRGLAPSEARAGFVAAVLRRRFGDDADVVGEASEVDAAIEMIGERLPDVVLGDVHMPEIGCQLGEFPFDIEPRSVPMDQRARGKSVAHIMEPWTTAMAFRDGTEAKLLG